MTDNIAAVCKTLLALADASTGELRDYLEFAAGFIRMYDNEADDALEVFLDDKVIFKAVADSKIELERML